MPLSVGDFAPKFSLPEGPGQMVDVGAEFGAAPVVILFFPLAFSSVCTEELCGIRDDWSVWAGLEAKVFGVSVDSPFVVSKFREIENLPFSLLSDFNKIVAPEWGAFYEEEFFGLNGVAKRAAFVVGTDGKIVYQWVSEDAGVQPDLAAVKAAVASCSTTSS
ncbi:MAG: redoxin domain-containing protein [Phycisphaerales bacterium]|nr:redoxin domain-containing protein [Phycisphaerales bacterium]